MAKRSGHEKRVVGLLDVLGASSALSGAANSRRFAEALSAIFSPIVRSRDEWLFCLPHILTGEEIEIEPSLPVTRGSSDPISGAYSFYQHLREVWDRVIADYNATSDERIRGKLRWMRRYFEAVLRESRLPYPRTSHASEPFATSFPRTADNLKSWVNDFVATHGKVRADSTPSEIA